MHVVFNKLISLFTWIYTIRIGVYRNRHANTYSQSPRNTQRLLYRNSWVQRTRKNLIEVFKGAIICCWPVFSPLCCRCCCCYSWHCREPKFNCIVFKAPIKKNVRIKNNHSNQPFSNQSHAIICANFHLDPEDLEWIEHKYNKIAQLLTKNIKIFIKTTSKVR